MGRKSITCYRLQFGRYSAVGLADRRFYEASFPFVIQFATADAKSVNSSLYFVHCVLGVHPEGAGVEPFLPFGRDFALCARTERQP